MTETIFISDLCSVTHRNVLKHQGRDNAVTVSKISNRHFYSVTDWRICYIGAYEPVRLRLLIPTTPVICSGKCRQEENKVEVGKSERSLSGQVRRENMRCIHLALRIAMLLALCILLICSRTELMAQGEAITSICGNRESPCLSSPYPSAYSLRDESISHISEEIGTPSFLDSILTTIQNH